MKDYKKIEKSIEKSIANLDEVKKLMEGCISDNNELLTIRATMLVNFGPEGRAKDEIGILCYPEQKVEHMVRDVVGFLYKKLLNTKNNNGVVSIKPVNT